MKQSSSKTVDPHAGTAIRSFRRCEPEELQFEGAEGMVWLRHDDLESPAGGRDYGSLLVQLNVDGEGFAVVTVDRAGTGLMVAVEESLAALQRLHAHLSETFGERIPAGQCIQAGGLGRCERDHGHDGEHKFPTEEEWKAATGLRVRSKKTA